MKWFLGVLLLLLSAWLIESSLLAYAMYVLLALLIVSRWLSLGWVDNITATRRISFLGAGAEGEAAAPAGAGIRDTQSAAPHRIEAEVGDTLSVRVVVINGGVTPIPWVLLEDVVPAKNRVADRKKLRIKKRRLKITSIGAKGEAELSYQVQFEARGYYQIGPLVVETGDFFGLHRRYLVATEPHYVIVYPRIVLMAGYELTSRRPIGEIRMSHRLYEDPTRIAGVREYQPGDPMNRVHWRATARTGALHCKIYEPSTIAGATILLDLHEDGYPNSYEPNRSEFAVTTAASLAFALFQMGQQVGLVTNGRDAAERIKHEGWEHDFRTRHAALRTAQQTEENDRLAPVVVQTGKGPEQFERIWGILARAERNDGLTFAQTLVETSSRIPRDTTVIAVLPRVTKGTAIALGNLRRRGYAVTAVLVMLEAADVNAAQGALIGEGVEVRSVVDPPSLSAVCQRIM